MLIALLGSGENKQLKFLCFLSALSAFSKMNVGHTGNNKNSDNESYLIKKKGNGGWDKQFTECFPTTFLLYPASMRLLKKGGLQAESK